MKKRIYWVILFIILYSVFEGASSIGLYLLKKVRSISYEPINVLSDTHRNILKRFVKEEPSYFVYSPTLGWTINKNAVKLKDGTLLYKANSQGIRGNQVYELVPPHNMLRMASFGDSFTHCSGVGNEDTWQEKLKALHKNLEVLNFGVGAFGTDQAFLRYQTEGVHYHPHIIFIGLMSENIFRNVNVFRPFYFKKTSLPLAKPRFIIQDEGLRLVMNPVRDLAEYNEILNEPTSALSKLGRNDYYYQRGYKCGFFDFVPSVTLLKLFKYNVVKNSDRIIVDGVFNQDSEPYQVTIKIFDMFYNTSLQNDSLPIILVFPHARDIYRQLKGEKKRYSPLLSYFDERGALYVDLLKAFNEVGGRYKFTELFGSSGHYSPLANELVANYILQYLKEKGFLHIDTIIDSVDKLKQNKMAHSLKAE